MKDMIFNCYKKTCEIRVERGDLVEYEDVGCNFNYEVSDIDVQMSIAEFIYEDYILSKLPFEIKSKIDSAVMTCQLWNFISDCELFDCLYEIYEDRLNEYYTKKAMHYAKD